MIFKYFYYLCSVKEMGGPSGASFFVEIIMVQEEFRQVVAQAAEARACTVVAIEFDDFDNIFEVVLDKENGDVTLDDCEFVHRAVLDRFDRNVEDYALTVGSAGIDSAEADEMLNNMEKEQ